MNRIFTIMLVISICLVSFVSCTRRSNDEVEDGPIDQIVEVGSDTQESNETEDCSDEVVEDQVVEDFPSDLDEEDSEEVPEIEDIVPTPIDLPEPYWYDLSHDEEIELLKISWAEAGNQDIEGKVLIMLVVMNRVKDPYFPDNVHDVIYQKYRGNYQFSTIPNGSFQSAPEDNEECLAALEMLKSNYDSSQGATYFESTKSYNSWHYRNLTFLFEHGDHWFYK